MTATAIAIQKFHITSGANGRSQLWARRMNVVTASILLLAAHGFTAPSEPGVEQVRQRSIGAPALRRPPRIVRIRPYRRPVSRPRSLEPDEGHCHSNTLAWYGLAV